MTDRMPPVDEEMRREAEARKRPGPSRNASHPRKSRKIMMAQRIPVDAETVARNRPGPSSDNDPTATDPPLAVIAVCRRHLIDIRCVLAAKNRVFCWAMNVAIERLNETQRLRYLCAMNAVDHRILHNKRKMQNVRQLAAEVKAATARMDMERLVAVYHRIRAFKREHKIE